MRNWWREYGGTILSIFIMVAILTFLAWLLGWNPDGMMTGY